MSCLPRIRHPAGNYYMFKVNNRSTRKRSEICSKLTIKTPAYGVVLVSLLLTVNFGTYFTLCSSGSIVTLEQINAGWATTKYQQNQSISTHLKPMSPLLQCVKSVGIRSFSGPYFPAFGLQTKIYTENLRIQSQCGKIRTRKTPNMDTFYPVFNAFQFLQHIPMTAGTHCKIRGTSVKNQFNELVILN